MFSFSFILFFYKHNISKKEKKLFISVCLNVFFFFCSLETFVFRMYFHKFNDDTSVCVVKCKCCCVVYGHENHCHYFIKWKFPWLTQYEKLYPATFYISPPWEMVRESTAIKRNYRDKNKYLKKCHKNSKWKVKFEIVAKSS